MDIDVIIIGAGLSGLVAARQLEAAGARVLVLEKARSTGGRMATRRMGGGQADHGAQFFTTRTPEFQRQIEAWMSEGKVDVWGYGWSDGSLKRTPIDGHPRYYALEGMNSLARDMAKELHDVRINVRIMHAEYRGERWILTDDSERHYDAPVLILTPPVPQSLDLLMDVKLTNEDRSALSRIEYGPCLCGLFVVEGEVDLPEPGALQDFNQPIYWIADNQRKGISPTRTITVHAGVAYSRQHFDALDETVLDHLAGPIKDRLMPGAHIVERQLKKWRYSVPLTTHPFDCLVAEGLPLIFAGDAFGGRGRMEGAYHSGLAAAEAALSKLGRK